MSKRCSYAEPVKIARTRKGAVRWERVPLVLVPEEVADLLECSLGDLYARVALGLQPQPMEGWKRRPSQRFARWRVKHYLEDATITVRL